MLPEEAQALMAKVLLVVFGTLILCMSKVRASEFSKNHLQISKKVTVSSIASES